MPLRFPSIETWGLVGQGHALPGSGGSDSPARSKPLVRPQFVTTGSCPTWQGMALPHHGPDPTTGRTKRHWDSILPDN